MEQQREREIQKFNETNYSNSYRQLVTEGHYSSNIPIVKMKMPELHLTFENTKQPARSPKIQKRL